MSLYANLKQEDLVDLLNAYDAYIGEAADAQVFRTGWTPVCIEEFYQIEYQEIWKQGQSFSDYFFDASEMSAQSVTAHDLALAIDQFYFDLDTYDYKDKISDREAAVAALEADLLSGKVGELREHLKNEMESYGATDSVSMGAKLLIAQLDKFEKQHQQAVTAQGDMVLRVENPDRVLISCYADNVLPRTDDANLIDSYWCANLVLKRDWAEEQVKKAGYSSLEEFFDNYTWDDTDGWYEQAFHDGALLGVELGQPPYDEHQINRQSEQTKTAPAPVSFEEKLAQAKETAKAQMDWDSSDPVFLFVENRSGDRMGKPGDLNNVYFASWFAFHSFGPDGTPRPAGESLNFKDRDTHMPVPGGYGISEVDVIESFRRAHAGHSVVVLNIDPFQKDVEAQMNRALQRFKEDGKALLSLPAVQKAPKQNEPSL